MSVYTVEPNDTLSEIAERFGITLSELLVANP
jgi:LysM repeat protein